MSETEGLDHDDRELPPEEAADDVTVGAWLDLDQPQPPGSVVRDAQPQPDGLWTRAKRALGLSH